MELHFSDLDTDGDDRISMEEFSSRFTTLGGSRSSEKDTHKRSWYMDPPICLARESCPAWVFYSGPGMMEQEILRFLLKFGPKGKGYCSG